MIRKRVYIAGAISHGILEDNIKKALHVGRLLIEAGFAPLVPHLTCFFGYGTETGVPSVQAGFDASVWYAVDMAWLQSAECLVRIPGKSYGADLEVAEAKRLGIPVVTYVNHYIGLEVERVLEEKAGTREPFLDRLNKSAEVGIA